MAPRVTVTLEGGTNLQATLRAQARGLADLSVPNKRAADIIVTAARMRAPRRSGRLAGSLRGSGEPDAAVVEAGPVYAPVQEYGWPRRHIPAQPFLVNSADATESAWTSTYQADLQDRLDHVKGT